MKITIELDGVVATIQEDESKTIQELRYMFDRCAIAVGFLIEKDNVHGVMNPVITFSDENN
jgi:hypothetical protein